MGRKVTSSLIFAIVDFRQLNKIKILSQVVPKHTKFILGVIRHMLNENMNFLLSECCKEFQANHSCIHLLGF